MKCQFPVGSSVNSCIFEHYILQILVIPLPIEEILKYTVDTFAWLLLFVNTTLHILKFLLTSINTVSMRVVSQQKASSSNSGLRICSSLFRSKLLILKSDQ